MARIRTIKPGFWKSEDLSSVSETAHLLAAALLNYSDDAGYFNANPALIRAECFPLRETSVPIPVALRELSGIGYVELGQCAGKNYGRVVKFSEHQVVNKPQPSVIKDLEIEWELSGSTTVALPEHYRSTTGGNGKEGNGKEGNGKEKEEGLIAPVADATPQCPHEEIVELYNTRCQALPRVRELTERRRKAIRTRWRENATRQTVDWWAYFFDQVASSPFLCGSNDRNWSADFDWLLKPENFVKVIEGRYAVTPVQRFSKTTQANILAAQEFINAN